MDRESIIELQKIDCNCNDCKFMVRDVEKFKESLEKHNKWQLDYFNSIKNNLIAKANYWKSKGEYTKRDLLMEEAGKMKFQFDKSTAMINFGQCSEFDKPVTFIPNVCQLDTQQCFEHRRS